MTGSPGSVLPRTWRFDAIGTAWQIDTTVPLASDARAAVRDVIETFDREWSRFRADSIVTALAGGESTAAAPPDAAAMLDAYVELDRATSGAVNPLVGASLAARGYDADYALVDRGAHPAPQDWRARLTWTAETLSLTEPALIDVGALGKGRLVDRVLSALAPFAVGDIV
ncbi:MAG TPA: FAD:protein FMN transferase, partial [Protaetiibacter sp.]|nr:FAD:protein FMN transferase [Protaetiibacter sp.]